MKRQLVFLSIACLFSMQYAPVWAMDDAASYEKLRKEGMIALDEIKRANAGDVDTMYALAEKYKKAGNKADARRWHQKAAVKGHAGALYEIGMIWENGDDVSSDLTAAYDLYLQAGRKGHPGALTALSRMHATGNGVLRKDLAKASELRRMAVRRGRMEHIENFDSLFEQLVIQSAGRSCNCVCL